MNVMSVCDGQTVGSFPPISTTTTVVIIETPIKAIIDGGSSVVIGQYHGTVHQLSSVYHFVKVV